MQLPTMLKDLPAPAMVLDHAMVVLAWNRALDDMLIEQPRRLADLGSLLRCMHAPCGQNSGCRNCQLRISVHGAAQGRSETQGMEVSLPIRDDGFVEMRNLLMGAASAAMQGRQLALVTLQSLSRREPPAPSENESFPVLDSLAVPVVVIDSSSARIVYANEAILDVMDLPAVDLVDQPCRQHLCPMKPGCCPVLDKGAARTSWEQQLLYGDGVQRPIFKTVRRMDLGGRSLVVETLEPVSEQHQAEEVITRQNERLGALVELAGIKEEAQGDVLLWALERAVGLTRSRAGYVCLVTPNQQKARLFAWCQDGRTHRGDSEIIALKKAGGWADCVRLALPVRHDDYQKQALPGQLPAPFAPSSHLAVPILDVHGVAAVLGVADKHNPYDEDDVQQLELFTSSVWEIVQRRRAEAGQRRSVRNLRQLLGGAIEAITRAVEIRDPYTAGHQRRVSDLARALAKELGCDPHQVDGIRMAAILHDIGKIAVPADILTKPSQLSTLEFELLKQHAQQGAEILEPVAMPMQVHEIVRQHHERLDGSGYPRGLRGRSICFEARILAVADTVEAMLSHRPFRPTYSTDHMMAELERIKNTKLDGRVVDACLRLFRENRFQFK